MTVQLARAPPSDRPRLGSARSPPTGPTTRVKERDLTVTARADRRAVPRRRGVYRRAGSAVPRQIRQHAAIGFGRRLSGIAGARETGEAYGPRRCSPRSRDTTVPRLNPPTDPTEPRKDPDVMKAQNDRRPDLGSPDPSKCRRSTAVLWAAVALAVGVILGVALSDVGRQCQTTTNDGGLTYRESCSRDVTP